MWLAAFDSDGSLSSTWYSEGGHDRPHFEELGDLGIRLAPRYWSDQYVAHFSRSRDIHPGLDPERAAALVEFLDGIGIGSVLFVPLGAGAECVGFLVLARISDEPPWTSMEYDAALGIGHDLGRAVANARQLDMERALVARLRDLDDYRSELMNTVAHELRSPLTAVMGNLEMVEAGDRLSDRDRRSVEAALRGARRIEKVIDDLLTVARYSDPRMAFDEVDVDLRAVVLDVVEESGHVAAARHIAIVTDLPREPVHAPGSAAELHRALANLVGNAVKYSDDEASVVVRIEARKDDVRLVVEDRGIGISEDDQTNLFREFQRSSNPEALRRPGTGLGLVIVQRIVRRHRGYIRVESELGRGTTVTITLPSTLEA